MDMYGYVWLYMFMYGYIWVYKAMYGFVWVYMGMCGHILGLSTDFQNSSKNLNSSLDDYSPMLI